MAGLPNSSNALQQWHHLFEAEGTKRSPQAQQHLQQLLRTGLPTRKHENWKYTPLEGLTNSQFVSIAGEISPQQRDALALTLDAVRLVFVDGRYVSALSDATEGSGYEVSINDDRQGVPSAASAQKPSQVIDSEAEFYRHGYAAVHRGIHTLSAQATEKMENVRKRASLFINARSAEELVFVRGTTEGINLVANSWGNSNVRAGDNIIISQMEHHANIVPWQMLCARVGAELRVIPLNPDGTLQLETLPNLFDEKTRLLAITHVSNVLGTENPLAEMITLAHQHGAKVLVDGAQAVMHHPVDVQALDCDFYVFSGHKLYGPTGIGILYVKEALLQEMPPWEGGGSMIATVSLSEGTTWTKAPWRFEAGTPNTGGIIGLGAALEYVSALGLNNIAEYEQNLMHYALSQLESVPDLTLYGPRNRLGVIAFNLGKHHAYDVGSFLDNYGIAVRTGHHCAMPLMAYYNVPAMCRASLAMYNTHEEVDRLVTGLQRIHRLLG
ncbi:cysteine desulfurase SufS [Escherichia coli]|nr:cysteine desulfurase SufS [Escherichia coli]MDA4475283.1 cysteine desulfurase SufS [Escherichia coli]